ncbi:MAG: ACT domain-containing protein [Firmicutes bacterium]|nr:ACT domain-containing protein [Bacillota bacterium]
MQAIVTVLGKDKVGLIAKVSTYLASVGVNVEEVSQTVVQDYFNMLMVVDISRAAASVAGMADGLAALGGAEGVVIRIQHEDIFNIMHKI